MGKCIFIAILLIFVGSFAADKEAQLKERASTDKEFYPYAQESIYLDIVD